MRSGSQWASAGCGRRGCRSGGRGSVTRIYCACIPHPTPTFRPDSIDTSIQFNVQELKLEFLDAENCSSIIWEERGEMCQPVARHLCSPADDDENGDDDGGVGGDSDERTKSSGRKKKRERRRRKAFVQRSFFSSSSSCFVCVCCSGSKKIRTMSEGPVKLVSCNGSIRCSCCC